MDTVHTPPDIAALRQRIRLLGEAIEADGDKIRQMRWPMRPGGLWVTADGETWNFHKRPAERPHLRPAS